MYITQILWLLALPIAIFFSYRLVLFVLKKFEQKYPPDVYVNSTENS